ncbi:hypothetical protein AHAS_Ahas12G0049000 [Arachis hypogaea]
MEQLPEVCRDKKMWKAFWSLRCAPKIKVFIWKACHDGLSVRGRLNKRFHRIPNVCPRCEEEEESVNHCLIQCHLANQTWQLSPVSHLVQALGTQAFWKWWSHGFRSAPAPVAQTAASPPPQCTAHIASLSSYRLLIRTALARTILAYGILAARISRPSPRLRRHGLHPDYPLGSDGALRNQSLWP